GKRLDYRGRGDLERGVFEQPGGNRGCFPRSLLESFDTYGQGPMEAFLKNVPGTLQVDDDEDCMFLSNMLSIILRHGTEKLKFKQLPGGYLYVDEIWKKMQKLGHFTKNDLMKALAQNDKQMFSLQKEEITGHLKIRDNQEHTMKGHGKKLEYNLGEHEVPVSQPYQLRREHREALDYQHLGSAEEVSRKRKINREAIEGIEKDAIQEPAVEQRHPAVELHLELALGSADAEDETEPCNQDQQKRRMNTLSGSPAPSFKEKMEDPIGLSPLWPVALEFAPDNNLLHLDPNHFFLGAPSTVMKSHAATVLQNIRHRALCHKDGRKVEFLSPDSAACVLKKERCVLPDGSIYELTSTWIPDPEFKEKKEKASQTEERNMKTLETGIQCDIIKLNI
ncbi:hypothetical protein CHS0354_001781, partial [Potamilus streckersoni]